MIYGDNPKKTNERQDLLGLNIYNLVPDINAIRQSTNLYVYGLNNPIYYVDPSGEGVEIYISQSDLVALRNFLADIKTGAQITSLTLGGIAFAVAYSGHGEISVCFWAVAQCAKLFQWELTGLIYAIDQLQCDNGLVIGYDYLDIVFGSEYKHQEWVYADYGYQYDVAYYGGYSGISYNRYYS